MKNFAILVLAFVLPVLVNGQSQAIDQFYKKHSGKEGVSIISLNASILGMMASDDDDEKGVMENITNIRLLVAEEVGGMRADANSLLKEVLNDNYEVLMDIKDGKDNINCLIKETKGIIKKALLIVDSEDELVIISIEGNIPLEDFGDIEISNDKKVKDIIGNRA